MTTKSSQFFEINRAFALAFRLISRRYSAATNITIKGVEFRPVSKQFWKKRTLSLTSFAVQ